MYTGVITSGTVLAYAFVILPVHLVRRQPRPLAGSKCLSICAYLLHHMGAPLFRLVLFHRRSAFPLRATSLQLLPRQGLSLCKVRGQMSCNLPFQVVPGAHCLTDRRRCVARRWGSPMKCISKIWSSSEVGQKSEHVESSQNGLAYSGKS